MKLVFADTYYYLAFLNRHDPEHQRVMQVEAGLDARIVTTAWVLTEVANAMAHPGSRSVAAEFLHEIAQDPLVQFEPPTRELYEAGLALYARRDDKRWSLTDCISFVVMREHRVTDALTADHHFEQPGFTILLK